MQTDAQPYVYEQTRKRKARRNDSLTLYLSSSVRRSRLAAAPPSPAAPRPLPHSGALPNASCGRSRAPIHQKDARPGGSNSNASGAQIPVYQARRKRLSQVKVTATRETPRHNERCPRHRNDAWGTACLTVKHQRAKPSDTSLRALQQGRAPYIEVCPGKHPLSRSTGIDLVSMDIAFIFLAKGVANHGQPTQ